MSIQNLQAFIARQLNDHHESPTGVEQPIYYEWSYNHITEALCLGLSYLYSILPSEFSEVKEFEVKEEGCIIDFCGECSKFLSIVTIDGDDDCAEVVETTEQSTSLLGLLGTRCEDETDEDPTHQYEVVSGSNCIVKFSDPLPKGTIILYMCATPPDESDLNDPALAGYQSLLVAFALWWLLRTDTESRSNALRWQDYHAEVKEFVEVKLLLEFSLREDDYLHGRRAVDD